MFRFIRGNKTARAQNTIRTSLDLAQVLLGEDLYGVSGVVVTPKTAMGVAAVQAAVRVLAENVGMLPFPIYKKVERDGREYKEKARDHSLWKVLNTAPNNFQSAQEFREYCVAQMLLYRHAYAFINRAGGKVRELIPIHSNRVVFKQNSDMSITYTVTLENGGTKEFSQKHIFHLRDMSAEGLHGRSRVQECRECIGLTKAAENYGGEFFKNDRTPSGTLSTKNPVKPDDIQKLRESWGATRGGVKILDNDFQFKAILPTAAEAQMLETRKFQTTEIARIFRIPPHKIGDNERSTFNNIEFQELDFQTNSMLPWYRRFELGVDGQLLTEEEQGTYYSKIDNRAMLRGDSKSRGEYYQKMKVSKIMTTNEIRDLEDMDPHPDGDVLENPTVQTDQKSKGTDNDDEKQQDPDASATKQN